MKRILLLHIILFDLNIAIAEKQTKFESGACRTKLFAKIVLRIRLGAHRARFWTGLEPSWAALGTILDPKVVQNVP